VIIAAVAVVLVVIVAAGVVVSKVLADKDDDSVIGYSTDAQVMLTQEDIDKAAEEALANAENGDVGLMYKNSATSTDGINFDCYIINSPSNKFDMFLTIYADAEMTDEIFLSQLVPVGSGFTHITLEHSLDKGDNLVYVVLTQVKRDEESIANQVAHTMDFIVS
jgi:hypothetical protein